MRTILQNNHRKKNNELHAFLKMFMLALIVGISSEIKFEALVSGFIIAMSVLMMGLFLYCFEKLNGLHFIFCCALVSSLIRWGSEVIYGGDAIKVFWTTVPDAMFFVMYAIVYTFFYRVIFSEGKMVKNFPIVVFCSDVMGNVAEIGMRSLLFNAELLTTSNLALVLCIAAIRVLIMQGIILVIEGYSNILLEQEMDKEFKRLLIQTSKLDGEMYVIEKNIAEMEAAMEQAYLLYRALESDASVPPHFKKEALSIARLIHEIKGDYKGVAEILRTQFMYEADSSGMKMSDIIAVQKKDVLAIMDSRKIQANISVSIQDDFYVKPYFEMFSVIRNLLMNAAEAFESAQNAKRNIIRVTVEKHDSEYCIGIRDNGVGMTKDCMQTIFADGFSTKFDANTGNIQRGLGLPLVKHYVEEIFRGSIEVTSQIGSYVSYTHFLIRIPQQTVEYWGKGDGERDEVLHS